MSRERTAAWCSLLLLAAAGCNGPAAAPDTAAGHRQPVVAPDLETVAEPGAGPQVLPEALLVNGDRIEVQEIIGPLRPALTKLAQGTTPAGYQRELVNHLKSQILGHVQDMLLYQNALVGVDDERMNEALDHIVDQRLKDRINSDFDGRQSRYEQHLRGQGRSILEAREDLRRDTIVASHLQETILPRIANPTRRELWEFYERNMSEFSSEEVRELWLIDIPYGDSADRARASARQAAQELADGRPFEEVAQARSRGVYAREGGAWGEITTRLRGRYAAASGALFELPENTVSEVIETDSGLFIVKVGRVQHADCRSFAEVQPLLTDRYRAAQFDYQRRRLLQRLLDEAIVEPDESLFLQALVEAAPTYEEMRSASAEASD